MASWRARAGGSGPCPFGARTAQALDRYLQIPPLSIPCQISRGCGWQRRAGLTPDGIRQCWSGGAVPSASGVHAHMFRHGFADAWLKAGGAEGDLQELAGGVPRDAAPVRGSQPGRTSPPGVPTDLADGRAVRRRVRVLRVRCPCGHNLADVVAGNREVGR